MAFNPNHAPQRLEDLHLPRDLVGSLLLRTIAYSNRLSGAALERRLGVPFVCLKTLIDEFLNQQFLEPRPAGGDDPADSTADLQLRMAYSITQKGIAHVNEMGTIQTRYLGPCPIAFDQYLELVRPQVEGTNPVTDKMLRDALAELELDEQVIRQIGGAMVSRSSLFIFGAPGNGKSTITERMALLMGAPVEIPYAVAVGEEIVRIIDPVYHRMVQGELPKDRRLVRVQRPVVMAGGELKMNQLDLTYDAQNRYYEAPLHWKANAGILVIDDFGRQEVPPMRLLNRFIVPMEKKIDYLDLTASGRKIELPFLCQLVFSTNISPSELVDEAFLRRMAYKIGIPNPSKEAYARILRRECEKNGVQWDESVLAYLYDKLYKGKPQRGSHPRQLIARLLDFARFRQTKPALNEGSVKEAFDACFNPALGGMIEDDWAKPLSTGSEPAMAAVPSPAPRVVAVTTPPVAPKSPVAKP